MKFKLLLKSFCIQVYTDLSNLYASNSQLAALTGHTVTYPFTLVGFILSWKAAHSYKLKSHLMHCLPYRIIIFFNLGT